MPLDAPLPSLAGARSLLADDDVWSDLLAWHDEGARAALVTLVAIDGTTPRALGAEMVVAADGRSAGYLSGGCFEQTVVLEAQDVLAERSNRLQRYGKGSRYVDLKLPCGSGLDLYFNQGLDNAVVERVRGLRRDRATFCVVTDLDSGRTRIELPDSATVPRSLRSGTVFRRAHIPPMTVLLVGAGPALPAIAHLIRASGLGLVIATPDDATRRDLDLLGFAARQIADASQIDVASLDRWSAAVVSFHDHQWEAPVLKEMLATPAFYIGALGSRTAHANRVAELARLGVPPEAVARVRGPIGLIGGAKNRVTLAVGVLAELLSEAKTLGMMP